MITGVVAAVIVAYPLIVLRMHVRRFGMARPVPALRALRWLLGRFASGRRRAMSGNVSAAHLRESPATLVAAALVSTALLAAATLPSAATAVLGKYKC